MAASLTIIDQIEKTVDGDYEEWQIGLTDDSASRKAELGNPLSWLQWQAESFQEAQKVLDHFFKKGMGNAGSIKKSGDVVYILLLDKPRLKAMTFVF